MQRKKRKPPRRKPGAQPGNKNALRHGFYQERFTANENKRLDKQDATDVLAEIALLRVCIDRLTEQLAFNELYVKDNKGKVTEVKDDYTLKALNTLGIMTQSLSTLTRTHYLVRGKSSDVTDSIMRALEELRLEMGL